MPRQTDMDTGLPITSFAAVQSRLRLSQGTTSKPQQHQDKARQRRNAEDPFSEETPERENERLTSQQRKSAETTFSEGIDRAASRAFQTLLQQTSKAKIDEISFSMNMTKKYAIDPMLKCVSNLTEALKKDSLELTGPADMTMAEWAVATNIQFLQLELKAAEVEGFSSGQKDRLKLQRLVLNILKMVKGRIADIKEDMELRDRRKKLRRVRDGRTVEFGKGIGRLDGEFKKQMEGWNEEVTPDRRAQMWRTKRVEEWRTEVLRQSVGGGEKRCWDSVTEEEIPRPGRSTKRARMLEEGYLPDAEDDRPQPERRSRRLKTVEEEAMANSRLLRRFEQEAASRPHHYPSDLWQGDPYDEHDEDEDEEEEEDEEEDEDEDSKDEYNNGKEFEEDVLFADSSAGSHSSGSNIICDQWKITAHLSIIASMQQLTLMATEEIMATDVQIKRFIGERLRDLQKLLATLKEDEGLS